MSIVAYTGLPGSGKSYGVVESVIIPSLKAGRTIVTNIPLKLGRLSDDYPKGKVITFSSDVETSYFIAETIVPGAIYVIDEAWRWFPSGTRANQVPTEEKQFFTEHRHFVGEDGHTCEIVLVTQNLNQVATYVKTLVEETYVSKKLTAVGQSNKFRIDVYIGPVEGAKPSGEVVRQLFGKYSADVFQYYSSHTQNKTEYTTGNEKKVTDRTNIFKSKKFLSTVIFAPLLLGFGFYQVYTTFLSSSQPVTDPAAIQDPASMQPAILTEGGPAVGPDGQPLNEAPSAMDPRVAVAFDQVGLTPHPTARISGFYEGSDGTYIQIDDSSQSWPRVIPARVCDFNALTDSPVCILGEFVITRYTGDIPQPREKEEKQQSTNLLSS